MFVFPPLMLRPNIWSNAFGRVIPKIKKLVKVHDFVFTNWSQIGVHGLEFAPVSVIFQGVSFCSRNLNKYMEIQTNQNAWSLFHGMASGRTSRPANWSQPFTLQSYLSEFRDQYPQTTHIN